MVSVQKGKDLKIADEYYILALPWRDSVLHKYSDGLKFKKL